MATKTAIITGACSGIGLALTHHLLSSQTVQWRVVLADINVESYKKISSTLDPERAIFYQTDVSSWEDNATLFKRAFEWSLGEGPDGNGRIDLFAANAGAIDKESVYTHWDFKAEPVKPNMAAIEVNLLSAVYGLKLFIHYSRRTQDCLPPSVAFTPAMIITGSSAGLYQLPGSPQYCASKYGLIGLTRSVGPRLLADDNLTVNAILPGMVVTGLTPPWLVAQIPQEYLTPMSTILRAFDDLIKEETVDGRLHRKTGQCLEAAEDKLFYREPVEFPSDGQRWLFDENANGIIFPKVFQSGNGNIRPVAEDALGSG